jgi:hypothetical protein
LIAGRSIRGWRKKGRKKMMRRTTIGERVERKRMSRMNWKMVWKRVRQMRRSCY